MNDRKQLFLFGQTLPGNESILLDRIRECAEKRNRSEQQVTPAIQSMPADRIKQIAVGSSHVAFLLTDNRVARMSFEIVSNVVAEPTIPLDKPGDNSPFGSSNGPGGTAGGSTSTSDPASAAAQAAANAASRTAKIRRIMMSRPGTRSGGFCRTGAIIDRARSSRPMIPASSVPEELIVQCQVVLQGKSREVIVRELQRTNLNVNEAVNNLLSRDDDEIEDLADTGESYLHEELLSLLDAGLRSDGGGAAALLDHDSIYSSSDGYDYVISRDLARRRDEPKSKDASKENEGAGQTLQEQFVFDETLEFWGHQTETKTQFFFPPGVEKFIKIASMNSELLALADDGRLYGWSWGAGRAPSNSPHSANSLLNKSKEQKKGDKIVDIETSAFRAVVLFQSGQVGSFMDACCGERLAEAFLELPAEVPDPVERLFCCTLFSAVLSKNGTLYWRGIYPFNERRKIWEKARSKKKQVANSSAEIVVGSEVRTKSTPIYSVGSVAVNFTSGLPMIGTLYEDAWTLNETCRFRVQTPTNYDNSSLRNTEKEKQREKRVSFSLAVGNRKRAAPTASDELTDGNGQSAAVAVASSSSGNNGASQQQQSKESAWAIKDVVFIHEEAINDVSIVKIIDGAYCGVAFKSTLERLEREGQSSPFDLSKMGIRLMRKDDLVPITHTSRLLTRAPDNFQTQFKSIRPPTTVKRIISLALDGNGFRILCEKKNQRVSLIRVSCLGKLLSDHPLPINLNALCRPVDGVVEPALPAVTNYGDENILLIRDSTGAFQPLLRNVSGGFHELAYTGIGRMHLFGMGIRYLKSPNEVNAPTISTEPFSVNTKNGKSQPNKNATRLLLMAALIAPNPQSILPAIDSLMQAVLNCDLCTVRAILQKLSENATVDQRRSVIDERIEGNRNVFHVAVMNAYAKTNRDQADVEPSSGGDDTSKLAKWTDKWDSTEADAARARFDRKWHDMLGGTSAPTTRAKAQQAAASAMKEASPRDPTLGGDDSTDLSTSKSTEEKATPSFSPIGTPTKKSIPTTPKERQANGIEIIRELCKNSVLQEYFIELMQQIDINGQTPFQCAIHFRAYTAAHLFWETVMELRDWNQEPADILAPVCEGKSDESALFVLCANDTCSYTWTGEEHTAQDIFECNTCGLTGTLCCCTECAYTCHRTHDCKPKHTSPTAYCDCWEKFGCRALISGNLTKREQLLSFMLQNGKLVDKLNSRGEHLLLFLVRTVGRQLVEHESYVKRNKRPTAGAALSTASAGVPEHDLEPPKFAARALELALTNWEVVRSLLNVGIKNTSLDDVQISESAFHLGEHHGSTHLDKFVFTLLAYCEESSLDSLLNLLIRQANRKSSKDPDAEVHVLISRFVRSVIRLFVLVILLSPNAVGALLGTISENITKAFGPVSAPTFSSDEEVPLSVVQQLALSTSVPATTGVIPSIRESLQNYRAVAISGMLSLVRASLPGLTGLGGAMDKKEAKKKNAISFIMKCRRVFQTLLSYSLNELIGMADNIIAPLRLGVVKPTGAMTNANEDVLELIQKHLSMEQDLSALLKELAEGGNNMANLLSTVNGNSRIKKLVEMRNSEMSRPTGQNIATNEEHNDQPSPSEDEMSNEEDDEDDEMEGVQNAHRHRARENSNASLDRSHRERTLSGGGTGRRERQETTASAEDELNPNMLAEDEHDEDEDEDAGDHGMEEDDEEPYFDVHDDDDDEEDDEDDPSDDTDENPSDAEAGDSNDTVPVIRASNTNTQPDGTGARTTGSGSAIHVEFDAATSASNNASVAITDSNRPEAATNASSGGTQAPTSDTTTLATNNNNSDNGTVAIGTSTSGSNSGAHRPVERMQAINGASSGRDALLDGSTPNRLQWHTSAMTSVNLNAPTTTASQETLGTAVTVPSTTNDETAIIEDNQYSQSNTSTQIALCFSVLVKLIDELLLQLIAHSKWKQQLNTRTKGITTLLDIEPQLFQEFKNLLENCLEPTWQWLRIIMDRTEAQLKYSQAIQHSFVGPIVSAPVGPDREDQRAVSTRASEQRPKRPTTTAATVGGEAAVPQRRFRKKGDARKGLDPATGTRDTDVDNEARAEFFSYFLCLLRSYSAENADDLPVLEYNALRNVTFVTEAHFFHLIFTDQLKQLELEYGLGIGEEGTGVKDDAENSVEMEVTQTTGSTPEGRVHKLRRFYQRSNSISYPLLSMTDQHHAFTFAAGDALPLTTRSQLLSADAERESLFALPMPLRSRTAHKEIAAKHGVQHPTHQSLTRPPLRYSALMQHLPSYGHHRQKQRSGSVVVKHYGDEENKETATNANTTSATNSGGISNILLNSRLGLDSELQRCLGRWSNTVTMFTRTFHEDLTNRFGGDSSHSVLLNKTGVCSFAVRHAQFRKQMDKLKISLTKDLIFSQMSREKYALLQQTFRQLNQIYVKRTTGPGSVGNTPTQVQPSTSTTEQRPGQAPILASHKVKVTFRDEPGEGTGVARHFYAALADAMVTIKHLPQLDNVNEDGTARSTAEASNNSPLAIAGRHSPAKTAHPTETPKPLSAQQKARTGASAATTTPRGRDLVGGNGNTSNADSSSTLQQPKQSQSAIAASVADTQPLFYRVSKTGFYTPISGSNTLQRLNAFRNIGRLIGICLQHLEIIPLPFCRHVLKYILNRPLNWFDLAFYDPMLFDSLRSIVYNEEMDEYRTSEYYEQLELKFSLDLPAEEGGGTIELKPDGANIAVSRENVLEYIYLFVEHRLLGTHKPSLDAMRRGVFDVIPAESLQNLTSEDLRLILCGTQEVSIQMLQNFTKFLDESSAPEEILAKYKRTFWSVVNKFSTSEKLDLCFFWTGSPSLPSTEEGFQPLPTIMIRPADDQSLPTANTCISRLYVPLYSSKKVLKEKLSMAIKARNFGFV